MIFQSNTTEKNKLIEEFIYNLIFSFGIAILWGQIFQDRPNEELRVLVAIQFWLFINYSISTSLSICRRYKNVFSSFDITPYRIFFSCFLNYLSLTIILFVSITFISHCIGYYSSSLYDLTVKFIFIFITALELNLICIVLINLNFVKYLNKWVNLSMRIGFFTTPILWFGQKDGVPAWMSFVNPFFNIINNLTYDYFSGSYMFNESVFWIIIIASVCFLTIKFRG